MSTPLQGRVMVYTNEVPYETDILRTNRYQQMEVSALAGTLLGLGLNYQPLVAGLLAAPTTPPALAIQIGPGILYALQPLDATDYGVLPADTEHQLYKQAHHLESTILATPPPTHTGDKVIHLVQAAFQTHDLNPISRPYFNAANPVQPIFETQPDTRQDTVFLQLKLGVPAPQPEPPTPDAGSVGLWYVALSYGQTSVGAHDITRVPNAPFITESLTQKISQATADARYVQPSQLQNNQFTYAQDMGTVNAIKLSLLPSPAAYHTGMSLLTRVAHTNTGAVTVQVNSLPTVRVLRPNEALLAAGDLVAGSWLCSRMKIRILYS